MVLLGTDASIASHVDEAGDVGCHAERCRAGVRTGHELTASEVQAVLSEGDDDRAQRVRSYERAHKNRAGVLQAAERELSNA